MLLSLLVSLALASSPQNKSRECLAALKETGVTSLENSKPLEDFLARYMSDEYHMIDFLMRNGSTIVLDCPEEIQKKFLGKITVLKEINKKQVDLCTNLRGLKEPSPECIQEAAIFRDSLRNINGGILGEAKAMKKMIDDRYTGKDFDKNLKYNVCCNVGGKIQKTKGPAPSDACLAEVGLIIRYACDENFVGLDKKDPRAKEFDEKYNKIDYSKYKDGSVRTKDIIPTSSQEQKGKR